MSSNIDLQLLSTQRGRSSVIHTHQPPVRKVYPMQRTVSKGGLALNLPVQQLNTTHGMISHYRFSPSTQMPSLVNPGSQIDIRVPAGSCGSVRDLYLEIDVKNNSLNPVTIAGEYLHNILQRVELLFENGSITVQRFTQDTFNTALLYDTPEENSHRLQMSAVDIAGIAPGDTYKAFVRLPYSVFTNSHLNIGGLKSDFFVRCYFKSDAQFCTSFPDVVVLEDIRVHVESINFSVPIQKALVSRMRNSTQDFKFYEYVEMKEVLNLAPSNQYDVRLSSVLGLTSSLWLWIRPNGHTLLDSVNSVKIDSYSLNDSSGKSILGSSSFDSDLMRVVKHNNNMLADVVNSQNKDLVNNLNYISVGFADASNQRSSNLSGGYYCFSGHERLVFRTPASLAPGSFELTIIQVKLNHITCDGGSISVHSS